MEVCSSGEEAMRDSEAFAPDRRMFGMEQLERLLADNPPDDPGALVDLIQSKVAVFAEGCPQSDDITCLALAWHGERAG